MPGAPAAGSTRHTRGWLCVGMTRRSGWVYSEESTERSPSVPVLTAPSVPRLGLGWRAMTDTPAPHVTDSTVDVATESREDRQARFEREAMPLLDQLYSAA